MANRSRSSTVQRIFNEASPIEFPRKLNCSAGKGVCNLSQARGATGLGVGIAPGVRLTSKLRGIELGMVECIKHLRPELKPPGFAESPILHNRSIPVLVTRATEIGKEAGGRAEGSILSVREGGGIE